MKRKVIRVIFEEVVVVFICFRYNVFLKIKCNDDNLHISGCLLLLVQFECLNGDFCVVHE